MRRLIVLAGGAGIAVLAAIALAALSRPDAGSTTSARTDAPAVRTSAGAADPDRGASVFQTCSACHTIGRGGADVDGPNLYGVVGARIAGRRPRYGYTQALRDVGGVWTAPRLDAWLTNPGAFAPGTAMHFPGLPDARDRTDVIAYLTAQGPSRP